MKTIYLGSSEFSLIVLENIYSAGILPSLIISQPDRPKGRGLKVSSTKVSIFAVKKNIPVIKPYSFDEKVLGKIRGEEADFFLVADYGKILPEFLLSLPKAMPLCVHPSLLPFYRGAAPIERTLINGEKETGVTIFRINKRVDSGDILLQKKIPVNKSDNIFSLKSKLAQEGAGLLVEALKKIEQGNYELIAQDEFKATGAPKLKKEDGCINWRGEAQSISNLVRATLGWPSAYTFYRQTLIKITEVSVDRDSVVLLPPSTIIKIDKQGIVVAAGKGAVRIKKVKPQGKKEMDAFAFVCGHRVKEGEKFA